MKRNGRGVDHLKEQKAMECALELKRVGEQGLFAGYASLFSVVDTQRDVVMPGAFRDTLVKREVPVKLLWQHRLDAPIGVLNEIFEDEKGLYIEGQLLLDVTQAREAFSLMKAGAVSGLSIGYAPRRYTRDPDTGVRKLHAVDLIEVSLVTLPANTAAQVTVVKEQSILPVQSVAFSEAYDRAVRLLAEMSR